jgi:Glycosyl transferase family 2
MDQKPVIRPLEQLKIRSNRWVRRKTAWRHMHPVDNRAIPEWKSEEVWMIVVCRNEALRLPYMLKYHFDLGVSRVLLIDNDSSDETRALAAADPRIHVFTSSEQYKGPLYWQEPLLRRYAIGKWCLVLDADELFAYPHMDRVSLPDLAACLEGQGAAALHSLFIEMFSREPIGEMAYQAGADFREAASWFDAQGYVQKKYHRVFHGEAPESIYMGGTRARMFQEEFGCSKYPFFKYTPNLFLRRGLHTIEGAKIAEAQGAVLHFKYLQDFKEKAFREARRGVYWNASAEYKSYATRFEKEGDFSLWHPGATHLKDWRQLVDLGLMKSTPALDAVDPQGGARP